VLYVVVSAVCCVLCAVCVLSVVCALRCMLWCVSYVLCTAVLRVCAHTYDSNNCFFNNLNDYNNRVGSSESVEEDVAGCESRVHHKRH
jgi:hypothetical protein